MQNNTTRDWLETDVTDSRLSGAARSLEPVLETRSNFWGGACHTAVPERTVRVFLDHASHAAFDRDLSPNRTKLYTMHVYHPRSLQKLDDLTTLASISFCTIQPFVPSVSGRGSAQHAWPLIWGGPLYWSCSKRRRCAFYDHSRLPIQECRTQSRHAGPRSGEGRAARTGT